MTESKGQQPMKRICMYIALSGVIEMMAIVPNFFLVKEYFIVSKWNEVFKLLPPCIH